ncbi:hypothetical protein BGZ58_011094 [Dissophora ornata]|nr:hypothetical protein BGZ58_011094 [Dissophora ornata]
MSEAQRPPASNLDPDSRNIYNYNDSNNIYDNPPAPGNAYSTERINPLDRVSQRDTLKRGNGTHDTAPELRDKNGYADEDYDGAIPPTTLMAANARQSSLQGLGAGAGAGAGEGSSDWRLGERDRFTPQLPQTPSTNDENETDSTLHGNSYRMLPLLVGCTVPVSILMNVASVTSPWLGTVTYDASTGQWIQVNTLPKPYWLRVLIILALVMSIICNLCVLFRFLERHTWQSVILSVIAVVIQDALGISAIVSFCILYPVRNAYEYLGGFWTMVTSLAFSLAATMFMTLDMYRTPYFRFRGSGVTPKQRILIAEAMLLCFYLAFGALIFVYLEQWTFLSALFFGMVTVTTIGFGNQVPENTGGRIFNVFYALGGIVLLAMVVNGIRYVILESLHRRFTVSAKRRKAERLARRQELKEKLEMEGADANENSYTSSRHFSHISEMVHLPHGHKMKHPVVSTHSPEIKPGDGTEVQGIRHSDATLRDGLDVDPREISRTGNAPNISSVSGAMQPSKTEHRPWWRRIWPFQKKTARTLADLPATVDEQREAERKQAYEEAMGQYRSDLLYYAILFIIFWVVGAVIFEFLESWSFGISVYFIFFSFTTIGYGGIVPTTKAGETVFIVYSLVGIVTVSSLASLCTDSLSKMLRKNVVDTELERLDKLEALDDANELSENALDAEEKTSHTLESDDLPHSTRLRMLDKYIKEGPVDSERTSEDDAFRGSIQNLLKVSWDFHHLLQKVLGQHPESDESQASQPGFEPPQPPLSIQGVTAGISEKEGDQPPDSSQNLAPSSPSLAPISSPTPGHRHGLGDAMTVATIPWQKLNQYARQFKALTDACEETLHKLAAWDASTKKLRQQRFFARLRQKRLLRERRRQLQNRGVPFAEDDIEKENELDELDDWEDDGDEEEEEDAALDRRRRRLAAKLLGRRRRRNHNNNARHDRQEDGGVEVAAASENEKPTV